MKIAYLVNQYPKVSHTFIRREITAVEALGLSVRRIAVRGSEEELVDQRDLQERSITHYILATPLATIVADLLLTATTHPRRLAKAIWAGLRFARKSDRPWFYHLIYLIEAC